ncbi:MAG: flagellar hook protein, partial [Planctomycetes bacterium]|nr:flagellar hook protein [Planctomycetota bacterium]
MSSFDIPSISFSGLASGLDTSSIIASLVAVKRLPIYLMESQKEDYQSKIKSFDTLKSKLDDLKDAAEDLKDTSDFNHFTATLSAEGSLTATASSTATPGTYTIEVTDLVTFEQE